MIRSNGEKWQLLNGEVYSCTSLGHSSRQKEEQVFIGKQKDNLDGAAIPWPYMNCLRVLEAMSYKRVSFLHDIKEF